MLSQPWDSNPRPAVYERAHGRCGEGQSGCSGVQTPGEDGGDGAADSASECTNGAGSDVVRQGIEDACGKANEALRALDRAEMDDARALLVEVVRMLGGDVT